MTRLKVKLEFEVREDFDMQEPGPTATPAVAFRRLQEDLAQLANRHVALRRLGFCLTKMTKD